MQPDPSDAWLQDEHRRPEAESSMVKKGQHIFSQWEDAQEQHVLTMSKVYSHKHEPKTESDSIRRKT